MRRAVRHFFLILLGQVILLALTQQTGAAAPQPEAVVKITKNDGPASSPAADPTPDASTDPTKSPPIVFPPGIIPSSKDRPQEKKITVSGVLTFNYSTNSGHITSIGNETAGSAQPGRGTDLGVGLDLNLGTYLLDPRFVKFSVETSFFWDKGAYAQTDTRQSNTALNLYTDFLPTSPYPLRFHYLKQNSNFLERQIESALRGRDSFGFNWSLRKPKLPSVSIGFDKTDYDSRFLASSAFKSKARNFNVNLGDRYFGWDINSTYSNQATNEGVTNLATGLNGVRLDARRQIGKQSSLYIGSYAEKLNFLGIETNTRQEFSFFDLHADLTSQLTEKLTARASYQFYRNVNQDESALPSLKTRMSSNALTGDLTYRLRPELTFQGAINAHLINSPDRSFESANRYTDFTGTVTWNRRIKSVNTRASLTQGLGSVNSNLGNGRRVEFHSYSAGLGFGSVKHALVTADVNSSIRPDMFQAGGFFAQRVFDVGIETNALRGFHLRASIGANTLDYLTPNGRDKFEHTSFSVSVDKRSLAIAFHRNTKAGVRDVFLVPIAGDRGQLFITLPVNSLIRDPLLNTSGDSTTALLRLRPKRNLEIEARYLKDKLFFVKTNNVFVKQVDVLVQYRIGKITVSSGAIFYRNSTEGLFSQARNYYYIRVSRPFNLF